MKGRKTLLIAVGFLLLGGMGVLSTYLFSHPNTNTRTIIEVHPDESIQAALDQAALTNPKAIVRLHPGVYRPAKPGQALISFNARHDGVELEGLDSVTLTAANPDIADPKARSFPAIVNHVIYCGDGVSNKTIIRNLKITGGNGFTEGPAGLMDIQSVDDLNRSSRYRAYESPIEFNSRLEKTHEFFCDGAGILVYGQSYPTIEDVEISGNYGRVCGGGVSIQHRTETLIEPVRFRNCIFRKNRAAVSGAAIDVFSHHSWIELDNCLFVENENEEKLDMDPGAKSIFPEHGFGVLSVFPTCRATVRNCTFTDNRSAVDDRGFESRYERCIFWNNSRPGILKKPHYELNVNESTYVDGCFIHGEIDDARSNLSRSSNRFESVNPDFDTAFLPRNTLYGAAGYRAIR
jgi:hypothetical protein